MFIFKLFTNNVLLKLFILYPIMFLEKNALATYQTFEHYDYKFIF